MTSETRPRYALVRNRIMELADRAADIKTPHARYDVVDNGERDDAGVAKHTERVLVWGITYDDAVLICVALNQHEDMINARDGVVPPAA